MFARRNLLAVLLLSALACKGNQASDAPAPAGSDTAAAPKKDDTISLNGAGATFPYPLYSKWISESERSNQLSVDWIGRRHSPNHRGHRRLRRDRRADEGR
jgi:ABC-type phosphate transport system substrate-binding protein